jgi:hypothetical protein
MKEKQEEANEEEVREIETSEVGKRRQRFHF